MLLICDNMNKKGVTIFNFSMFGLVVILAVALVGFGPAKLLELERKSARELVN